LSLRRNIELGHLSNAGTIKTTVLNRILLDTVHLFSFGCILILDFKIMNYCETLSPGIMLSLTEELMLGCR
jgi:hypothetical protein